MGTRAEWPSLPDASAARSRNDRIDTGGVRSVGWGTAAGFRTRAGAEPPTAPPRCTRVLAGYRRNAGGRGQALAFGAADLAAVLATCHRPAGVAPEPTAVAVCAPHR